MHFSEFSRAYHLNSVAAAAKL